MLNRRIGLSLIIDLSYLRFDTRMSTNIKCRTNAKWIKNNSVLTTCIDPSDYLYLTLLGSIAVIIPFHKQQKLSVFVFQKLQHSE